MSISGCRLGVKYKRGVQQFSFCFTQRYDPFVVGPVGPEKSPDGDTTNWICGASDRKMRIAMTADLPLSATGFNGNT